MEPTLELRPDARTTVCFCDERRRSGAGAPIDAIASVTLAARDHSWGEFLSRKDLLALRTWVDRVLSNG